MRGLPDNWAGPNPDLLTGDPIVGWVGESEFGLITFGSSSCPVVAGELHVIDSDDVSIPLSASPNDPCTADMAATTHVFDLPSEVTGRPVTVRLTNEEDDAERVLTLR
ncbi:hypothetical protein BJ978_001437 [Agromyces terreus]|uniref:Uncharacterized protein n=1 Tax=Agromyces terreus TaxID=424795 RepID=A0A9X2H069_9MICO|nr:hypothetical protein [Agromyces terreus]